MLAQQAADAAEHAGPVGVAEQREARALVELEVEALAPGLEQVRAVAAAERRARDAVALVAVTIVIADQVGEVARDGLGALGDADPALLGQRRRVDEVDVVLGSGR